ncbi:MAG: bifunctional adenosylcobinamide kinase/adenosylcobinamide-phosphate guanylyltransferase [Nitrospirota bacterium]
MSRKLVFITGGARSGKSTFALKEASKISGNKAYIATAEALDEEMRERLEDHKRKRGKDWDTYEEPISISEVIKKIGNDYRVIVIDCLTLWLSNLMHSDLNIEIEIEHLISSLVTIHSLTNQPYFNNTMKIIPPNPPLIKGGRGDYQVIYIVSNEVGMGIVPENEMARKFRDMAGVLNQKIAEIADEVYLVAVGIPMKIK